MSIFSKFDDIRSAFNALDKNGRNPFDIRFEKILSPTEAVLDGRRILLFGTNNYLGLTFDPTCVEASVNAIYEAGTGTTGDAEPVGDAESVQLTFDPRQISLGKILQIYFSVAHNPTELNYQGPDVGTQYRSEIFYANDEQKRVAEAYIAQLNTAQVFANAIVTKVEALPGFNPAAGSDQDFAVLHPDQSYIVSNDQPKIANLKSLFPDYYRETPVTVLALNKTTD